MADAGHVKTDEILEKLERRIREEYKQAEQEVQQKLNNYLERFERKDNIMRRRAEHGIISQDDYITWRRNQILVGERWKEMQETLAQDYHNANMIARQMVKQNMPEVYALNHNFATYQVEHDARINMSYTLYNREAVEHLLKNDPKLLPDPAPGSATARKLAENKDLRWNRQHISSAVTQGILQGEPIKNISKRLMTVTNMDTSSAIRNARTMITSAQNKGRQDAYDRLKSDGVDLTEVWVSTLDGRTRHSHRLLHGATKDSEGRYPNGLEYPGDPDGEPEEVYNCRCTEIAMVKGFDYKVATYSPKMGTMSFDEWQKEKGPGAKLSWNTQETAESAVTNMFGYSYGTEQELHGMNVKIHQEQEHGFPDGKNGVHQTRNADVYEVGDLKIYFPSDMNKDDQTLAPDQLLQALSKIPESYRNSIQKSIQVVDYSNPQDAYWAKKYHMKNFKSYMTGGMEITIYAHSFQHDDDYLVEALCHEGGHYLDRFVLTDNPYEPLSESSTWKKAMKLDEKIEGDKWVSDYAESSKSRLEDFADSCSRFIIDTEIFKLRYPNRYNILERYIHV